MKKGKEAFKGKLHGEPISIFSKMTELAMAEEALNLAQGFPDFPADPRLIKLLNHYAEEGFNQYAPGRGVPELRQTLCQISAKRYGTHYDWQTEINITAGATQGIATAMATFIKPGDEVIMFAPVYDCYAPMVRLNGGKPVVLPLNDEDFSIDWQQVEDQLSHRTRMMIINSPHNPSGRLLNQIDLDELERLAEKYSFLLLGDEVYEHIVFNEAQPTSLRQRASLRERSLIMGSLGKSLHITGWKVGYCLGPAPLMDEFYRVHQFNQFCIHHPSQRAMAQYLEENGVEHIGPHYEKKQNYFEELMRSTGFEPLPTFGSYFQLYNYRQISQRADMEFTQWLTAEHKVAAIPLSPFYAESQDAQYWLRFCFAKQDETLEEAAARLSRL